MGREPKPKMKLTREKAEQQLFIESLFESYRQIFEFIKGINSDASKLEPDYQECLDTTQRVFRENPNITTMEIFEKIPASNHFIVVVLKFFKYANSNPANIDPEEIQKDIERRMEGQDIN